MDIILRNRLFALLVLVAPVFDGIAHAQTAVDPSTQLGQVEQDLLGSEAKQKQMAAEIEMAIKTQSDISNQLVGLAKTLVTQETAAAITAKKIR